VTQAFDRAIPLAADRLHLLFSGLGGSAATDAADLDDEAVVCTCNAVTAGAVRACAADGCRTVAEVACRTRATTGCGTCTSAVGRLVESTPESAPERRIA
jgi:assimilatory nitrate reductase electron transfer subunit